jgi:hypothetical protein
MIMADYYYVTIARNDGEYRLLAGPYATHEEALANVQKAKNIAIEVDRATAIWCAYGTAKVRDYSEPGILNRRGLM